MDPRLTSSLARLADRFREDPRCLGMFLWGSMGQGNEDAHSDVDVALVIRDEAYGAVRDELRAICEEICGPIAVWLPEGESAEACNYAFLFEAGDDLLLYDFTVMSGSELARRRSSPGRILFDAAGLLKAAAEKTEDAPPSGQWDEIIRTAIKTYWVYAYLDGKYFRRSDIFKLLYVQGVLFQTHMKLLNALHPEEAWTWWARDVKHLPEERRRQLLVYFGAGSLEVIPPALRMQADFFSEDARAACRNWSVDYPDGLEAAVRKHLRKAGMSCI